MQLRGCRNGNTFYHRELGGPRLVCSLNEYVFFRLLWFIPLIPDLRRPLSAGDMQGGGGLFRAARMAALGGCRVCSSRSASPRAPAREGSASCASSTCQRQSSLAGPRRSWIDMGQGLAGAEPRALPAKPSDAWIHWFPLTLIGPGYCLLCLAEHRYLPK